MPTIFFFPLACLILLLLAFPLPATAKMIVASPAGGGAMGASSLATTTLAAALGAEYLALPVALSADGHPVVFHPLTLETSTDVQQLFPEKQREDGHYYPIDFTLEQLRRLRLHHPPLGKSPALDDAIATLPEHLAALRRLETILARPLAVIVEPRAPWFYRQEGHELSRILLGTLQAQGYAWPRDKVFLQCYDPEELQLLHRQLFPELAYSLPLIQLIGGDDGGETKHNNGLGVLEPYNYDWLFTNVGLKFVASYAMALALPAARIDDPTGIARPLPPWYIDEAHRHGLLVLVLPPRLDQPLEESTVLIERFLASGKADGLYSGDPLALRATLASPASPPEAMTDTAPSENGEPEVALPATGQPPPPLPGQEDLPPFFRELDLSRPTPRQDQDGPALPPVSQ